MCVEVNEKRVKGWGRGTRRPGGGPFAMKKTTRRVINVNTCANWSASELCDSCSEKRKRKRERVQQSSADTNIYTMCAARS